MQAKTVLRIEKDTGIARSISASPNYPFLLIMNYRLGELLAAHIKVWNATPLRRRSTLDGASKCKAGLQREDLK